MFYHRWTYPYKWTILEWKPQTKTPPPPKKKKQIKKKGFRHLKFTFKPFKLNWLSFFWIGTFQILLLLSSLKTEEPCVIFFNRDRSCIVKHCFVSERASFRGTHSCIWIVRWRSLQKCLNHCNYLNLKILVSRKNNPEE